METKKLSRLKKLVAVMLTLNTIVCLGTDAATVTAAYRGEIVLTIGCFVAALFNAVAVWLLNPLHDAMTEELEERHEHYMTSTHMKRIEKERRQIDEHRKRKKQRDVSFS